MSYVKDMGKRSRSNLIADLKTAGQKGSLSKMNKTQLLALHSQITDGASHDIEAGQSLDMLQIRGGGGGSADDNLRPVKGGGRKIRVDPDPDDVQKFMTGGSFWKSLGSDISNASSAVVHEAKELQKNKVVQDVELAGVDVGEVAGNVGADAAALAGATAIGNPELAGPAAIAVGIGTDEAADSLRNEIRNG